MKKPVVLPVMFVLHLAHDRQKWLHMDLIHLFKMLVDFFLAAFDNFLRMFLQTCQVSN